MGATSYPRLRSRRVVAGAVAPGKRAVNADRTPSAGSAAAVRPARVRTRGRPESPSCVASRAPPPPQTIERVAVVLERAQERSERVAVVDDRGLAHPLRPVARVVLVSRRTAAKPGSVRPRSVG